MDCNCKVTYVGECDNMSKLPKLPLKDYSFVPSKIIQKNGICYLKQLNSGKLENIINIIIDITKKHQINAKIIFTSIMGDKFGKVLIENGEITYDVYLKSDDDYKKLIKYLSDKDLRGYIFETVKDYLIKNYTFDEVKELFSDEDYTNYLKRYLVSYLDRYFYFSLEEESFNDLLFVYNNIQEYISFINKIKSFNVFVDITLQDEDERYLNILLNGMKEFYKDISFKIKKEDLDFVDNITAHIQFSSDIVDDKFKFLNMVINPLNFQYREKILKDIKFLDCLLCSDNFEFVDVNLDVKLSENIVQLFNKIKNRLKFFSNIDENIPF